MAEINTDGKGGKQKGKPKKLSTRVDLTPMVDLMFLLITFFMLATSMIKPQTMEIVMPAKDKDDQNQSKVNKDLAITVLLDKNNKLYYYEGTRTEQGADPELVSTDYSPNGLRKYLLNRNAVVLVDIRNFKQQIKGQNIEEDSIKSRISKLKGRKDAPVVIIKATKDANYGNLVNVLDEMQICNIGKYAVVDITPYDLELITKKKTSQGQ
jgi:biopolymer transport protein ExbD